MIESTLDRALSDLTSFTPLLIASDYDGTLAPIVDDPASAVPDPRALDSFLRLGSCEGSTSPSSRADRSMRLRHLSAHNPM